MTTDKLDSPQLPQEEQKQQTFLPHPDDNTPPPKQHTRQLSTNFSELDFMDSGLGRSLTSELPVLALQHDLIASIQHDDSFAEEFLLSKLQDAQRRLQEVRDYKASLGTPHGVAGGAGAKDRRKGPAAASNSATIHNANAPLKSFSSSSSSILPHSPLRKTNSHNVHFDRPLSTPNGTMDSTATATRPNSSLRSTPNKRNQPTLLSTAILNGLAAPPTSPFHLFVASYRLPLTVEVCDDGRVESTASSVAVGLATAFKTLSARYPVCWVGAPGQIRHKDGVAGESSSGSGADSSVSATATSVTPPPPPNIGKSSTMLTYKPVFPDAKEAASHQEFCSSVLWPLFHYISFNLGERSYHAEMFHAYVRVNRFYAQRLVDEWRRSGVDEADALFWVHDFQLCLVPKMIRDALPNARIGFFLHIPFPTREVFRILAPRKELLEGMLGADLLGFHTHDYARHFLTTCERVLELRTRPDAVDNRGTNVHVTICPFGIDAEVFIAATKQPMVTDLKRELQQSLKGKKIIIGIDRLDYIKGIPHKLLAIEHFFENHPEWIGRVVFLQVTTPSTAGSDEYHAFRSEILEMVGRINGRFATIEDTPIHYREFNMTLEKLCALYAGADVAMITSLRDGMNLVSYEYIACQNGSNGVLILSEFAGAAKNLPGAVLVNPWDIEGVSDAIVRSLEMTDLERNLRYQKLYHHVIRHSSSAWGVSFVEKLITYSTERRDKREELERMPVDSIVESYRASKGKRVFFLDYDGTLRKYETQPELAYPSASLLRMLQKLTTDERNIVFIVTGRGKTTMWSWFRGTGVGFAVEHGFSLRWPDHLRERFGGRKLLQDDSLSGGTGTETGTEERPVDDDSDGDCCTAVSLPDDQHTWDDLLKPDELIAMRNALHVAAEVLHKVEESTPSSFVSEKESAFSWHFRDAEPTLALIRAQEARQSLEERLAGSPMEVLMGQMILYVRPRGVHKGGAVGEVLKRLLAGDEIPSWIFSVGDDCTDEDMFTELYQFEKGFDTEVNTCTVGKKTTAARYFVSDVDDVVRLLNQLANSNS